MADKYRRAFYTRKSVQTEEDAVYQRLNFVVDSFENGNQAEFARRIGVRSGVVGDMFGKRRNKPSFDVLSKIVAAYPQLRVEWLLTGRGRMLNEPYVLRELFVHHNPAEVDNALAEGRINVLILDEIEKGATPEAANMLRALALDYEEANKNSRYPSGQGNVQARGLLSDIKVIELRRVSFKARASFNYAQLQRFKDTDIFDTVLFRLPPGRTEEDYKDAIVFDIEGDSMEPSLRDGQSVIAWPVSEAKWEYLHNTICVVDYDETVTVKAILKNDLNNTDGLTLYATGGLGGSFTVAREHIHTILEVREFYGVVPVRLLA